MLTLCITTCLLPQALESSGRCRTGFIGRSHLCSAFAVPLASLQNHSKPSQCSGEVPLLGAQCDIHQICIYVET